MRPVSSWGRLNAAAHRVVELGDPETVPAQIASTLPGVAFGNGRSYGDVCLNPGNTLWDTRRLDHLIRFDASTGHLACEAGVLLGDIQRIVVQQGWMLPVTPGTQMVTVGGAIANDVHGKNHHRMGGFGNHLIKIALLRTNGEKIVCGPDQMPAFFAATVGGLGLTGVIQQAQIQLRPVPGPWMQTETQAFRGLSEFFHLSAQSNPEWEHSVSWIDCLSGPEPRGLLMRGRSAAVNNLPEKISRPRSMPFVPPFSVVNRLTLKPFNAAYYHLNERKRGIRLAHYQSFFYPLDHVTGWNRMYGPRGFYQYQSAIPAAVSLDATAAMLKAITRSGEGSFLAVLKTFGERPPAGMLSFPRPGVTLALDFPNRGDTTRLLLERLDAVVREAGGRIYAAKDARMPRDLWESGYPRLGEFLPYRDPGISSAMSRRLMGS